MACKTEYEHPPSPQNTCLENYVENFLRSIYFPTVTLLVQRGCSG